MSTTLTSEQLQQQYIAYFGRPGDPSGIKYWLSSASGITTAREFADKIYAQDEYKTSTVGSKSTEQQVDSLYKNLFGRSADASGLLYWTNQIKTGVLSLSNIAYDLIAAASNPVSGNETQATADALALSNKVAAAEAYTAAVEADATAILAYSPESSDPWVTGTAFASGVTFLSGITSTAATSAEVTSSVNTMKTTTNEVASQAFALTSNTDNLTGGAGADTFTANSSTFNSDDSMDGGAGSDTFSLTTAPASGTATSTIGNFTSIETVKVTQGGAGTQTLNLISATGVTDVGSRLSSGDVLYTNVQSATTVTAYGTTGGDISVKYLDSLANSTTNDDSITLIVDGGALVDNFEIGGTTASAEFETINITSQGSVANTITDIEASDDNDLVYEGTKVVVSGDTKLTLGASGASLDLGNKSTIDGSAMTGAFVVYGDDAGIKSITGGSGDDTINLTGRSLAGSTDDAQTFDGGAGADTLTLDFGIAKSDLTAKTVDGVVTKHAYKAETLNFKEATSADATIEVGAVTGLTTIEVDPAAGDNDNTDDLDVIGITGVTTQKIVVDHTPPVTAGDGSTDGVHVSVTLNDATGTADSIAFELKNTETASELGKLTAAGAVESISITASPAKTYQVDALVAASATSVTITHTGAGELILGGEAASDFAASTTTVNSIIDASASTGKVTLGTSAVTGVEASSITLTGGSGNDKFYFGTTLDNSDIIDGGAGTDTVFMTEGNSTSALKATITADVLDVTAVANDQTIDLANMTVGEVNIASVGTATTDEDLTFDNALSTTTFDLVTTTSKDFDDDTITIGVATGQTNANVKLSGTVAIAGNNPGNILTDAGKLTINDAVNDGTYYESHTLNIGGTATTAKLTSLVLTGGGANSATATSSITLDNENAHIDLTSIDATGLDSDLVVSGLVTTGLADDAEINLGSGDNSLTIAAGDATIDQLEISGGAGTDTVVIADLDNATYRPGLTGVEVLDLNTQTEASDNGAITLDLSDADSALTKVQIDVDDFDFDITTTKASQVTTYEVQNEFGDAKTLTLSSAPTVTFKNINEAIVDGGTQTFGLTFADATDVSIVQGHASNISLNTVTLTKATKLTIGNGGKAGTITADTVTGSKLTDLVISTEDGNISVPTVTAAKLVNVTVTGDNTLSFGTTGATTTVLNSFDGSANTGAITIGTSVDFANNATVKTGTGNDSITVNVLSEGGLTIDAGEKASDTDTLVIDGLNNLGLTVIDLSQTDQLTQLNGAVNGASQGGFEYLNLSGLTGSQGASIVGSTDVNKFTTMGTDNTDTFNITDGSTSRSANIFAITADGETVNAFDDGDTITGFVAGSGGDTFDLTATAATDFQADNSTNVDLTSAAVSDLTAPYLATDNKTLASATTGYDADKNFIIELSKDIDTLDTMSAAGFRAIFGNTGANGVVVAGEGMSGIFIAYDGSGTDADAGIFYVNTSDTAGNVPTQIEAADVVAHIATLVDVGAGNITSDNFI